MKFRGKKYPRIRARRAPQGARGLKFVDHRGAPPLALVAPRKGRVG